MIISKPLGMSAGHSRTEDSVGESLIELDSGIGRSNGPQRKLKLTKLIQLFHALVIGLQELFDTGAFVRAEGIIQIPTQQLITKFSGE